MTYPFKVWGFGETIALRALWQVGPILHEPNYHEWVIGMLNRWLRREPRLQEADHSAPGIVLLDAYNATGDERYLSLALGLADYMAALPRDKSGAAFHRPTHPDFRHFIYVDCIEVDAPFLCRLAQITGESAYYDKAVEQISAYSGLLQDPASGLFYHQYDGESGQVNGAFWGRGNGWAMLGLLETLIRLPREHSGWDNLQGRLSRQAEALAACQLPSGDWPTVLDQPTTYAEGSLAAMFYYAYTEAMQQGYLPDKYAEVADRAWTALEALLALDGILQGVSIATPPGNAEHYARIERLPPGAVAPWGQGPALLACLARLETSTTHPDQKRFRLKEKAK